MEIRSAVTAEGDPVSIGLRGYASTTGDSYEVSDWLGEYRETINPGAFGKTLKESKYIPLLLDHRGDVLAAYHEGDNHTMDVAEDKRGLLIDASLDTIENATSRTVASGVKRGDLSKMSFAFQAVKDSWSEDFAERGVDECRVFDVSVVKSPANPMTSVGLRSDMVDWLGREGVATLFATRQALESLIETRSFEDFEPWAEKSLQVFRSVDEYMVRAYPYAGRARTFQVYDILLEVRAGKQISSANEHMLRTSLEALAQADNALKQVAGASGSAQLAIGTVLGDTVAMQGGEKVTNDGGIDTGKLNDGNPVLPNDGAGPRNAIPSSVQKAVEEVKAMKLRHRTR
jgi:HK97 family phage prohead protease